MTRQIQVILNVDGNIPLEALLKELDKPWIRSYALHTSEGKRAQKGAIEEAVLSALPGRVAELALKTGLNNKQVIQAVMRLNKAGRLAKSKTGVWRVK